MMTRPNTVAGLREMHATIAGQIEAKRTELARLVADLEAVEHTLRLFDPDAQLPKAKPLPSPHAAFKGEMRRDVLAALRVAKTPLSSLDITQEVCKTRQFACEGKMAIMMRKRVGAALYKLKMRGIVEEVPQAGEYKGWRLA